MCGIAGILRVGNGPEPDRDRLIRIRDHMARRGPDDAGIWHDEQGRVSLAHRRLSIIDTSAGGHQPMASPYGSHVITYNGEIYNFRELRRELSQQGYRFVSTSDTEVLLALYHRHGVDMFSRLRGMYAMAIWDDDLGGVLLARDPYGIKPLYYTLNQGELVFASQVKAIQAGGGISKVISPAAEAGFLLTGSVPEPHTWFEDIRCLPAGSWMWVDCAGAQSPVMHQDIKNDIAMAKVESCEPGELQQMVRQCLLESVEHHLVADVPVGVFLSAGIDSGALVALAVEKLDAPITTITLGFEEYAGTLQDERPLAEIVSRRYATHHHERLVDQAEFAADLPQILDSMDQPSIDGINTWFVSKAAAELGLKVMLSGVGGDELFGGYPSFQDIPRWRRRWGWMAKLPGLPAAVWAVGQAIPGQRIPVKAWALPRYAGSIAGGYLLRRGLFMPDELPELMAPDRAHAGLSALRPPDCFGIQGASIHGRISAAESGFYLRNQLLRDTDWSAMAHSVEVRTPLVDVRLSGQLAGRLAARPGKQWLANSPVPALPAQSLQRAKSGFTTPIGEWMSQSALLSDVTGGVDPKAAGHWSRRYALALLSLARTV